MIFRIARALGQPNPDAMLKAMPGSVLREWLKFYEAEPWSEAREDYRAAIVAHTVYHSSPGTRGKRDVHSFMVRPVETLQHRMEALKAMLRPFSRRKVKNANDQ